MSDEFDIGFGLDVSEAVTNIAQVEARLKTLSGNLLHAQKTISQNITAMTQQLSLATKNPQLDAIGQERANRQYQGGLDRAISSASGGSLSQKIANASATQFINAFSSTASQVSAKTSQTLVDGYSKIMKTTDEGLKSQLRNIEFRTTENLKNTSEAMLKAQTVLGDKRRAEISRQAGLDKSFFEAQSKNKQTAEAQTIRRAQVGNAQYSNENTLERLGSRGGSDLIAIQSKVLIGFQALSLVFRSVQGMASFIVQLDKEFRQFQAITATTNAEMTSLKNNLIAVSEQTKFTALEVSKAATIMGQAGLSAREVGDSVGAVTLLATAAGTELSAAVDLVTSTLSIFNLQTRETGDVADTMTTALNRSKLTIEKLALGFQYAGNVAAQLGVTYQELTGVLGALANSGIRSGSTLGTGLRQLLIDLQEPSQNLKKVLNELKLTEEDINIESQGLIGVLTTLKNAGFGAAAAFGAFEVRAASAYAALTNNLELATLLQKEFILSAAAAEANEVQMLALANTGAKLQSVIGTVIYNAFEPLIEVMQRALNVTANWLKNLNEYPRVLNLVAVAMTAVATAIALSTFNALFAGIARGVPILAILTGNLTAVAVAQTAVGVTAGTTTTLLSRLFLVMKANPIIAVTSLLFAGAVALAAFGTSAKTTKKDLDALEGTMNTLQGEMDTTMKTVAAVDQTIANLIKRRESLNADPLMREARILEVIQSFKELGLEVDASSTSIDTLIDKLEELRGVKLVEDLSILNALITTQTELIETLNTSKNEVLNKGNTLVPSSRSDRNRGSYAQRTGRNTDNYNSDIEIRFGPDIAEIAKILTKRTEIPSGDYGKITALSQILSNAISKLTTEQSVYSTQNNGKKNPVIEKDLEDLHKLSDASTELFATMLKLMSEKVRLERLDIQRMEARVQTSPLFADAVSKMNTLNIEVEERFSKLKKSVLNMTDLEYLDEIVSIQNLLQDKTQDLKSRGPEIVAALVEQGFTVSETLVAGILDGVISSGTASASLSLGLDKSSTQSLVNKTREEFIKSEIKAIEEEIRALGATLTTNSSQTEVNNFEKALAPLIEGKKELTSSLFGLRGEGLDGTDRIRQNANLLKDAVQAVENEGIDLLRRSGERTKTITKQLQDRRFTSDTKNNALDIESLMQSMKASSNLDEREYFLLEIENLMDRKRFFFNEFYKNAKIGLDPSSGDFEELTRQNLTAQRELDSEEQDLISKINSKFQGIGTFILEAGLEGITEGIDDELQRIEDLITNATGTEPLLTLKENIPVLMQRKIDAVNDFYSTRALGLEGVDLLKNDQDHKQALAAIERDRVNLIEAIATRAMNISKKVTNSFLDAESNSVDLNIENVVDSVRDALVEEELDQARDMISALMTRRRMLAEQIFDNDLEGLTGDALLDNRSGLREVQAEIDRQEEALLGDVDAKSASLTSIELKNLQTAVNEEIAGITKQIEDTIAEMDDLSPGVQVDGFMSAIRGLFERLNALTGLSASLGIQSEDVDMDASVATKAAMAMKFFQEVGNLTKVQAASMTGGLITESNLSTTAKGDKDQPGGYSLGIAQWREGRLDALKVFAADLGKPITDFYTQLAFVLKELDTTEKRSGDLLRSSTTVLEGVKAAVGFERPKGYTDQSPESAMHFSKRYGYAKLLAGQDYVPDSELPEKYSDAQQNVTANGIVDTSISNSSVANNQIATLRNQAAISQDSGQYAVIIKNLKAVFTELLESELNRFDAENAKQLGQGDVATLENRKKLQEGIAAQLNSEIDAALESYGTLSKTRAVEPLKVAQANLSAAQQNPANFTESNIIDLERVVQLREQEQAVLNLTLAEQRLMMVRNELKLSITESGLTSESTIFWLSEEKQALDEVSEAAREATAQKLAMAQTGPSVDEAINSANRTWLIGAGIVDTEGKLISMAAQVEKTWGTVLDTLSSGFSKLFIDLSSGTMNAKDAFRAFGLSVIDMFMKMISQALAYNVMLQLVGDPKKGGQGGGSGIFGSIFEALSTVGVSQIPGAANGEILSGYPQNRDGMLRRVMPGEAILRRSAVQSIGADKLRMMNAMGNRALSSNIPSLNDLQSGQDNVTNVWVVTPDQRPDGLGPNDVIATVSDNIARGGSLKKLIRSVRN